MTHMEKPDWIKKKVSLKDLRTLKQGLKGHGLHSVCEEAGCPNISDCFSRGVATVMIMGDICTRSCRFCNVKTGRPKPLDPEEPLHVADWVRVSKLKYVVITSVDRDDLNDLGASHFADVINYVKRQNPAVFIEALTPDFKGREDCISMVCNTPLNVFNHNIETVERLTSTVRSASDYRRSLAVLYSAKKHYPHLTIKSGMMLGLGEQRHEVIEAMKNLVQQGCEILTLGQYLQPSKKHLPVAKYLAPALFDEYKAIGEKIGFKFVFSKPFVRSSYLADEIYRIGIKA
ncbi:MAG: lipoyl synthase [Deltaproteobacteria bacterium]|nr:lipoyl synthase [Deltaproteobacteria bacterium]